MSFIVFTALSRTNKLLSSIFFCHISNSPILCIIFNRVKFNYYFIISIALLISMTWCVECFLLEDIHLTQSISHSQLRQRKDISSMVWCLQYLRLSLFFRELGLSHLEKKYLAVEGVIFSKECSYDFIFLLMVSMKWVFSLIFEWILFSVVKLSVGSRLGITYYFRVLLIRSIKTTSS